MIYAETVLPFPTYFVNTSMLSINVRPLQLLFLFFVNLMPPFQLVFFSGLKPYVCEKCGLAFGYSNHLQVHINVIHKSTSLFPFISLFVTHIQENLIVV